MSVPCANERLGLAMNTPFEEKDYYCDFRYKFVSYLLRRYVFSSRHFIGRPITTDRTRCLLPAICIFLADVLLKCNNLASAMRSSFEELV